MSLPQAHRLVGIEQAGRLGMGPAWTLRLTYIGRNDANVSGESFKFWQIEHAANDAHVTIRWGRIGARGQTQRLPCSRATISKAGAKLRKGYQYDTEGNVATPVAPADRFAQAIQAVRWTGIDIEGLADTSAIHGWIRVDAEIDASPHVTGAILTRTYVDRYSVWWIAAVLGDDQVKYGHLVGWP